MPVEMVTCVACGAFPWPVVDHRAFDGEHAAVMVGDDEENSPNGSGSGSGSSPTTLRGAGTVMSPRRDRSKESVGISKTETMPTDACHFFYDCTGCGALLRPKRGDCCVFCSFGSVPCPPIQEGGGMGACCK